MISHSPAADADAKQKSALALVPQAEGSEGNAVAEFALAVSVIKSRFVAL
jgi:hypothetical protein